MLRAAFAICWALHGVHALVAPNGNNHRVCNRGQPPSRLSRLCAEKTSPRELYVKSAEEEMDEVFSEASWSLKDNKKHRYPLFLRVY
jgi:hypothetical protein